MVRLPGARGSPGRGKGGAAGRPAGPRGAPAGLPARETRLGDGLVVAMVAACPFPCPRGTPIRIHRLAEALADRGHTVHVLTYHFGGPLNGARFQVHRIPDIRVYRRHSPGPAYRKLLLLDPLLAARLWRFLRTVDVDVIHAHHVEGFLAAWWAARGRWPVVFDVHTLLETELPSYTIGLPGGVKRWLGGLLDRRLPGRAAHVVAVTETIRRRLLEGGAVDPERISVAANGVEPFFFDGSGRPRSPSPPTLAFAGNLGPYQGIDLLLQAFRRVLERRPAARLLILSDDDFAPYEPAARELGIRSSISLASPELAALPDHLSAVDVAVNPRVRCEGIPQKLMNYMATGRAIVSFRGSAGYLVDGVTALLADDGDVAALAAGILRLLDDPGLARRLGRAARREARTFTWDATARRVEAVYDRVLTGRAPEAEP